MEENKNIMSPKRSSRRVNALKNISYVLNNSDDENSPIKKLRIHNLEKENNQNESLSEYEKIRLQNIAERDKMFKQFKLKNLASNLNKTLPKLRVSVDKRIPIKKKGKFNFLLLYPILIFLSLFIIFTLFLGLLSAFLGFWKLKFCKFCM